MGNGKDELFEYYTAVTEYKEAGAKVDALVQKADKFLSYLRNWKKRKPPTGSTDWPGPEEVSAVLKAWWGAYGRVTKASSYPTAGTETIVPPELPED